MKELTIIIDDNWANKEFKNYLISLNGILDANIKDTGNLKIDIKYNPNIISEKVIKMEILLFLNLLNIPSILSFDKHSKEKTISYKITPPSVCCEYCFKGWIEDLFEIPGIEKVEHNFNEFYYQKEQNKLIITINYNPNLISNSKLKQIESDLEL